MSCIMSDMTKEKIIEFMNKFKEENGAWPSSYEFDHHPTKPCSVKTIERKFGGIVKIKEEMGIKDPDFRTSTRRSIVASKAMAASLESEHKFHKFLVDKYDLVNVHRWEAYDNQFLKRADFGIYTKSKKHYFIDVFYAGNIDSALKCLAIKLKKIPEGVKDKIYFVCTNRELNQGELYTRLARRKVTLQSNVICLTIQDMESKILDGEIFENSI